MEEFYSRTYYTPEEINEKPWLVFVMEANIEKANKTGTFVGGPPRSKPPKTS